jgi:hypothetical protein
MLDHRFLVKLVRMCQAPARSSSKSPRGARAHTAGGNSSRSADADRRRYRFIRAELDGGTFTGPWNAAMYSVDLFDQAAKSLLWSFATDNANNKFTLTGGQKDVPSEGTSKESWDASGPVGQCPDKRFPSSADEIHQPVTKGHDSHGHYLWTYSRKSCRIEQLPLEGILAIEWVEEDGALQRMTSRAFRDHGNRIHSKHPGSSHGSSTHTPRLLSPYTNREGADYLLVESGMDTGKLLPESMMVRQSPHTHTRCNHSGSPHAPTTKLGIPRSYKRAAPTSVPATPHLDEVKHARLCTGLLRARFQVLCLQRLLKWITSMLEYVDSVANY